MAHAWHRFRDRVDAGEQLAAKLAAFAHRPDVLVLGLPRGGVPVAAEVARARGATRHRRGAQTRGAGRGRARDGRDRAW